MIVSNNDPQQTIHAHKISVANTAVILTIMQELQIPSTVVILDIYWKIPLYSHNTVDYGFPSVLKARENHHFCTELGRMGNRFPGLDRVLIG